jgi:hypothetical protein
MSQRAGCLLLLSCALGCSGPDPQPDDATQQPDFVSDQVSNCIADNPASEPFDVGDVTPPGASMQTFVTECEAAEGSRCNEAFISKGAARCIGVSERFEPGLEPWTIGLRYHNSFHRVVWGVENLLENQGGFSSGKSLTLDAVDGKVLGRTDWDTISN